MNILILDDTEFRHEYYRKLHINDDVTSVKTFYEYKVALKKQRYDIIYLDHDLGGDVVPDTYQDKFGRTIEHTGTDAAIVIGSLLVRYPEFKPGKVIIQSINAIGAQRMQKILDELEVENTWEPFICS